MSWCKVQVQKGWEVLLAKQPGFQEEPRASILRGLIAKRLLGKFSDTEHQAVGKQILKLENSWGESFIMRKVSQMYRPFEHLLIIDILLWACTSYDCQKSPCNNKDWSTSATCFEVSHIQFTVTSRVCLGGKIISIIRILCAHRSYTIPACETCRCHSQRD